MGSFLAASAIFYGLSQAFYKAKHKGIFLSKLSLIELHLFLIQSKVNSIYNDTCMLDCNFRNKNTQKDHCTCRCSNSW